MLSNDVRLTKVDTAALLKPQSKVTHLSKGRGITRRCWMFFVTTTSGRGGVSDSGPAGGPLRGRTEATCLSLTSILFRCLEDWTLRCGPWFWVLGCLSLGLGWKAL